MSFAKSLQSFSVKSWNVRAAAFGIDALHNGSPIRLVVMPLSDAEQMGGGYEASETVRAECVAALQVNDRVQFDGKNYRVEDVRKSQFSQTRVATLIVSP